VNDKAYKNYLLAILLIVSAFSSTDRVVLGLVLQDVKADLALSDTQLGFLIGPAFAVFYSTMGVPIARWADRGNRVLLISFTTALWSVAVALCGIAGSLIQLLLMRVCVAVGEAGCMPVANSLIADSFTRIERPRAVSRYLLGAPLSALLGYVLGGWLNQSYGWRTTFVVLGAPGVLVAAVAWLTLREPRHSRSEAALTTADPAPGFIEVCVTLWKLRTFRHLLIGQVVMTVAQSGTAQWLPTFFVRTHGLGTGTLGSWLGSMSAIGSSLGILLGGELTVRYASNNETLQLKGQAVTYLGTGVIYTLAYLSPNPYVALGLYGLALMSISLSNSAFFALIQTLVPTQMRAQAIALLFLATYLIGMSLGPVTVGSLSDLIRPWAGNESLRYVLLALFPACFWGAWHIWHAGRTVAADLQEGGVAGSTDGGRWTIDKSSNVVVQRSQHTPAGG
jgi:MFS family permease